MPSAKASDPLVTVEMGELPIILSAPHGGLDDVPGVQPRRGRDDKTFVTAPDLSTNKLTESIADAIEKIIGKRPYVLIANFHRKYLDANRSPSKAYESAEAKKVYDRYHNALAETRQDVIERWGYGILLDIHGQDAEPDVVFRGTNNGRAATHLVSRFGWPSLLAEPSLFGQLAKNGLKVFPDVGSSDREDSRFNGGYIVAKYGSRHGGTLDALQLEFGKKLRLRSNRSQTADRMASAVVSFGKAYLRGHDEHEFTPNLSPVSRPVSSAVPARQLANPKSIFEADFTDGDPSGWIVLNNDLSKIQVKTSAAMLENPPELHLSASDESSLKSLVVHFSEVRLEQTGDAVKLQFDAFHKHKGFVDRGFRFGVFYSDQTTFRKYGDVEVDPVSLDDDGYFAVLDLGEKTMRESAAIRETTNSIDQRLWDGSTIQSDSNGNAPDPLMFTPNQRVTYSLTLARSLRGNIETTLRSNVGGDDRTLTGTSNLTPVTVFDTLYFGTIGTTADFAIDNVTVTQGRLTGSVVSDRVNIK